ncbi:hypothetical protein B0H11DRAFT_2203855, partial [Mycena galericulata]
MFDLMFVAASFRTCFLKSTDFKHPLNLNMRHISLNLSGIRNFCPSRSTYLDYARLQNHLNSTLNHPIHLSEVSSRPSLEYPSPSRPQLNSELSFNRFTSRTPISMATSPILTSPANLFGNPPAPFQIPRLADPRSTFPARANLILHGELTGGASLQNSIDLSASRTRDSVHTRESRPRAPGFLSDFVLGAQHTSGFAAAGSWRDGGKQRRDVGLTGGWRVRRARQRWGVHVFIRTTYIHYACARGDEIRGEVRALAREPICRERLGVEPATEKIAHAATEITTAADGVREFDKAEAESPAPQQVYFRFELHTPDTSPPAHAFTFTPPRMSWPAGAPVYTLPYADYEQEQDEEEHEDELDDPGPAAASGSRAKEREREKEKERMIRRRSSKACDQCRKSKCKCERSAAGVRCRACEVLGTECTFLGPSRKRGPPKGYIDAIEARLHQTEALVGIMLAAARGAASIANSSSMADNELTKGVREDGESGASAGRGKRGKGAGRGGGEDEDGGGDREEQDDGGGGDARAWAVLRDLGEDPLARAILARIDNSAYGPAGRGFGSSLSALLSHSNSHSNSNNPAASHTNSSSSSTQTAHLVRSDSRSRTSSPGGAGGGGGRKDEVGAEIASTHPSHEWMDRVTVHVLRRAREARGREARNKDKGGVDNRGGRGAFEHSP